MFSRTPMGADTPWDPTPTGGSSGWVAMKFPTQRKPEACGKLSKLENPRCNGDCLAVLYKAKTTVWVTMGRKQDSQRASI